METRPYRSGDEQAIIDLFYLTFRKPLLLEEWNWRYRNNPLGDLFIYLMWDGTKLVGHYAVSPVRMKLGSTIVKTALSLDTMTHPDYVGRGIFTSLAEATYHELVRRDYAAVWGFPNTSSHYGFRKNLAWKDLSLIPMLVLKLDQCRMPDQNTASIIDVEQFDSRFDQLELEIASTLPCSVIRDARFLNWRFKANPSHQYKIIAFENAHQILAYAVMKLYKSPESLFVDLVDLLATPSTISVILSAVIQYARSQKAFGINTWMNVNHPFYLDLEKSGFEPATPVTYWGVRSLRESTPDSRLYDYRSWYLTMGDSDVY